MPNLTSPIYQQNPSQAPFMQDPSPIIPLRMDAQQAPISYGTPSTDSLVANGYLAPAGQPVVEDLGNPTGEPKQVTASAPAPEYPKYQPIQTGNTFMSTGAAIGGAAGGPLGAAGGAVVGYGIDSLLAAKEKAAQKRELERQMRLSLMKQQHDEKVARGRQRVQGARANGEYFDNKAAARRQQGMQKLQSIYQGMQEQFNIGAKF